MFPGGFHFSGSKPQGLPNIIDADCSQPRHTPDYFFTNRCMVVAFATIVLTMYTLRLRSSFHRKCWSTDERAKWLEAAELYEKVKVSQKP